MKKQKDIFPMLELMTAPAFCVKDAKVDEMNSAAKQLMLEKGTPIADLLGDQYPQYESFDGGCLFVTLDLDGCQLDATVNRVGAEDVFIIDQQAQVELRIMALVSQSLRLPLADLISLTDGLLPTLETSSTAIQKKKISQINRKLTQLNRAILNMADASRYTSDSGYQLCMLDGVSVVDEILERAQMLLEHTDVKLDVRLPQESILVYMDAEKIERTIYNLLSNAVKATPAGGTVQVELRQKNDYLYLSVQDSGNGIPASVMGNIFTRYQRSAGLEDGRNGLGLGMTLVRATAAVHGGTVLIQQPPAGGTKVTLSIPIKTGRDVTMRYTGLFADYAGDRDHGLLELSEVLPAELYSYID